MKTRLGAGRWWGGVATDGMRMPYGNGTGLTLDLASHGSHGQASPFYVSDDGRYLCSPKSPFSLSIGTDGNLEAEGMNLLAGKGEGTLKSGYQKACWRYFPPTGKCPPAIFFSKPQFSTWMEYFYDLDQEKVLAFATRILEEGYQPGIFIIDDGWMSFYGSFEFDLSRFPDPGKLIRNLHEMGFVVLVWASPFVSTDSVAFRNLEDGAVLLKDKDGEIAIRRWWNGCSALVDLTVQKDRTGCQQDLLIFTMTLALTASNSMAETNATIMMMISLGYLRYCRARHMGNSVPVIHIMKSIPAMIQEAGNLSKACAMSGTAGAKGEELLPWCRMLWLLA